MTTAEVADYLRVPPATLYTWRHRNTGPKAVRVGRHLRYRTEDLQHWLQQQTDPRPGAAA